MNQQFDNVVWRAFETSATARAIERGAGRLRAGARGSRAVAAGRSWLSAAATDPGAVVIVAALTHLIVTALFARPVHWQWMILPAIALCAGAVLAVTRRRGQP